MAHHKFIKTIVKIGDVIHFSVGGFFAVDGWASHDDAVQNRQQNDAHDIRNAQSGCNRKGLVAEYCARHSLYKNQRHKHRNRGQCATQKRRNHLASSTRTRSAKGAPALLPWRNVFADYQCVVYHHTHHEYQSRKRNDIKRPPRCPKYDESDDYCRHHTDSNHERRPHASHKKHCNNDNQDETEDEILFEIGDCIIQKFGLIAADFKFQVWKLRLKLRQQFANAGAHLLHSLVSLFDDRQCNDAAAICKRKTLLLLGFVLNVAKIAQLQEMTVAIEIDIAHVVNVPQQCSHADSIFENAVFHTHRTCIYIVGLQGVVNVGWLNIEETHFVQIREYFDALLRYAGNVSHRHFGQLFDAAADDIVHGVAHLEKLRLVAAVVCKGNIEIKNRNI